MNEKHQLSQILEEYQASEHCAKLLGIEIVSLTTGHAVGSMPVSEKTIQPLGILHGGASVVLAETLCSVGGWFSRKDTKSAIVGLEINANHLRMVKPPEMLKAEATAIHLGSKTHVWETRIWDSSERLVCLSRCTLAVIAKPDLA